MTRLQPQQIPNTTLPNKLPETNSSQTTTIFPSIFYFFFAFTPYSLHLIPKTKPPSCSTPETWQEEKVTVTWYKPPVTGKYFKTLNALFLTS